MDILNFISWIKGGRVVTSVDPSQTLIPVGLKDGRRDDGYLSGAITVADLLGNAVSGAGISEYKQALLPSKSLVTASIPRLDLIGKAFDLEFLGLDAPFIELANGNIAQVFYCQSVLKNGILIYEAYDVQTEDPINGYWVAFKQNEQNPKLLEKVGELQMTAQFWDRWYDWTVKDSGDNQVKFTSTNFINFDSDLVESFITTLTYENGTLTAVDSNFDFGGVTALQLYNSLSGYGILESFGWNFNRAEYILDDDYYGMAIGSQAGWCYYRDPNSIGGAATVWDCVGFNVLTGETRWVTPVVDIVANVTNFNFTDVDTDKFIQGWFNHPNGITFQFSDNQLINNGNNVNGVTCIWSPFYQNSNEVIYLTTRDISSGLYLNTGGIIKENWYWDNENFFVFSIGSQLETSTTATGFVVERYNTNTKVKTSWVVPNFTENKDVGFIASWANNNGLLLTLVINNIDGSQQFGSLRYLYFTNDAYYLSLQSNNYYPTNLLGNKTYSTWSGLIKNVYNVGVEIDEYTNVKF
jgi:hypothetical protein